MGFSNLNPFEGYCCVAHYQIETGLSWFKIGGPMDSDNVWPVVNIDHDMRRSSKRSSQRSRCPRCLGVSRARVSKGYLRIQGSEKSDLNGAD